MFKKEQSKSCAKRVYWEKQDLKRAAVRKVSVVSIVVGLIIILTILDMLTSLVVSSTCISQNFGIYFRFFGRNFPSSSGRVSWTGHDGILNLR